MKFNECCIRTVFIMLGNSCNFSCRHCVQEGFHSECFPIQSSLSDDTVNYLSRLASLKPFDEKIKIMFWGGEPLVYFDSIKNILSQLSSDKFIFSIVSNGALLTPEIVSFLNDNNVSFTLSHDGVLTKDVRVQDVFEDESFCRLFSSIKNKSINAIISAYNCDYYNAWEYFDSVSPDTPVSFEFLMCNWDMPSDLYNFDLATYRNSINKVINTAFIDTLNGNISREFMLLSVARDNAIRFITSTVENKPILLFPRCGQMRTVLNIDCSGNVYACHNYSDKIGTIHDSYDSLLTVYDSKFGNITAHEDCKSCEFLPLCCGGCPYSKPSIGKDMCCAVKKIFYQGVLDYISKFADDKLLSEVDLSEVDLC